MKSIFQPKSTAEIEVIKAELKSDLKEFPKFFELYLEIIEKYKVFNLMIMENSPFPRESVGPQAHFFILLEEYLRPMVGVEKFLPKIEDDKPPKWYEEKFHVTSLDLHQKGYRSYTRKPVSNLRDIETLFNL
jgi:hypothetical protein